MTITKLAACMLLLVTTALPCQAAAPTPEQIIDAFFGPNDVLDRAAAYTGEMKRLHSGDPTLGKMLGAGASFTARRLPLSRDDAPIYAVTVRDGDELVDWYAYFARDDGAFKLMAVRAFGRGGLFFEEMQTLGRKTNRSADEEWRYQNLRVSFLPDAERLAHFRNHLAELDALKAAIDTHKEEVIHERMSALHFRGYERNELGQLEIWLGAGLLTTNIGVLYVPPGEKPPPIDETDHLYIEQIEGPWYVYKTT